MKYLAAYVALFFCVWLWLPGWTGFDAQWHTFYWDSLYCKEMLASDGGLWQLIKDFFGQFMANPWTAAALWAVPFTVGFWLLCALGRKVTDRSYITPVAFVIAVSSVWLSIGGALKGDNADQRFKEKMCLVADEDWDKIISLTKGRKLNNVLELNIHNLALAEKGLLARHLMEQPCHDVNALFVLKIESPYVAAMLSDIYWSMGEISMSQMYAFEANEKMNNLSPRLLKRLVKTNIAFGHYKVAEKYLNWLDKTLFERNWARHYRQLLSDEAVMADKEMRLKRLCIPKENGFPSAQSVAYDLQNIINNNPEHRTSAEYLGALKQLYTIQ